MQQIKKLFQKKRYLYSTLLVFLGISVFVSVFVFSTIKEVLHSFKITEDFNACVDNTNKSTIYAKEFLLTAYTDENFHKTGRNKQLDLFDEKYNSSLSNLSLINDKTYQDSSAAIRHYLEKYKTCFYNIVSLTRKKGYKDLGVEGEMRNAVHTIEGFSFLPDVKPLLSLRRHEKDFLLRKDLKYKINFDKELAEYITYSQSNTLLSDNEKTLLVNELQKYGNNFNTIVEIEKELGFSEDMGLRKELAELHFKLDNSFGKSQSTLQAITQNALNNINIMVWVVTCVIVLFLIAAAAMYNFIQKDIRKPLGELNIIADQISNGKLDVDFGVLNKSLFLSKLSNNIERIVDKFSTTISQMELVSNQKKFFNESDFAKNDHVGAVLSRISKQIEFMVQDQKDRNWQNDATEQITHNLKEQESLSVFCQNIIRTLVGILKANQASMFLVEEAESGFQLKLSATYAYHRKKFIEKILHPGEGLVGQCFIEKEEIFMTEIPADYINITSGLGEARPRSLYIMPMINNGIVEAVLEIASFNVFKQHERDFLMKIGESIASAIYFIRVNENTRNLLETSRMQTEQLRAQEEEMRQNIEELSATQEQLLRRETTLQFN